MLVVAWNLQYMIKNCQDAGGIYSFEKKVGGNLSGIKAVPAFCAAQHYLGQAGVTILMISLFAVILTSLIGNLMALSRLFYAMGRDHIAPKAMGKLNRHNIPGKAVRTKSSFSLK